MADKLTDEERELIERHRAKRRASRPGANVSVSVDLSDDKAVKRAQKLGFLDSADDDDEDDDDGQDEDDDTPRRGGRYFDS